MQSGTGGEKLMTKYKTFILKAVFEVDGLMDYEDPKDTTNEWHREFLESIPRDCRSFKALVGESQKQFDKAYEGE
jgi:hypothetical protein